MERPDRFDEKLARIFEATQAKGDTALATILGIKPPSVAAARKRRQIPTGWVEDIAERFHISADWLFFGRGPMLSGHVKGHPSSGDTPGQTATGHSPAPLAAAHLCAPSPMPRLRSHAPGFSSGTAELVLIPRVAARLNAGSTVLSPHGGTPDMFAFRADWLERKGEAARMVLLDITGDAMSPEIKHGDMVLIDQSKTSVLGYGYFAVSVEDAVMVKQLRVRPGTLILHSLHKDYEDIEVDMKEELPPPVHILGRVVWVGRDLG